MLRPLRFLEGSAMNRVMLLIPLVLGLPRLAPAQKLPVRSYTVSDGLPHDDVRRIIPDSRGFIWFCPPGGLSRFDGERFTTYEVKDGLPAGSVADLLESRDGRYYWVAAVGGVWRFN